MAVKTVRTKKGTELPLLNLKGKDYLQVAHRIQWFTEEVANFTISSEFLVLDEQQTVCRTTIQVTDENGRIIRSVSATKRETARDFSDHTEKAETGAIGRALVALGYGTQFALADLDEGNRLADSPVVNPKTLPSAPKPTTSTKVEQTNTSPSFKRSKPAATVTPSEDEF